MKLHQKIYADDIGTMVKICYELTILGATYEAKYDHCACIWVITVLGF